MLALVILRKPNCVKLTGGCQDIRAASADVVAVGAGSDGMPGLLPDDCWGDQAS